MQQYLYAAAPFAAVIAYLIIFFLDKQKRDERKEQRKYGKKPQGRVSYLTEGATAGMLVGIVLSSMKLVNSALALWAGLVLGSVIGAIITKKED